MNGDFDNLQPNFLGIALQDLKGIAFQDLKGGLYPCVGLKSQGRSVKVNFGPKGFKYLGNI